MAVLLRLCLCKSGGEGREPEPAIDKAIFILYHLVEHYLDKEKLNTARDGKQIVHYMTTRFLTCPTHNLIFLNVEAKMPFYLLLKLKLLKIVKFMIIQIFLKWYILKRIILLKRIFEIKAWVLLNTSQSIKNALSKPCKHLIPYSQLYQKRISDWFCINNHQFSIWHELCAV